MNFWIFPVDVFGIVLGLLVDEVRSDDLLGPFRVTGFDEQE